MLVPRERGWGLLLGPADLGFLYVCMRADMCAWQLSHGPEKQGRCTFAIGKDRGDDGINVCLTPHPCAREMSALILGEL